MNDGDISINADNYNHENGGGLENLLERIKKTNIELKVERAMENKLCFIIIRIVYKFHGFFYDVEKYVASIKICQNNEKSVEG